MFPLKSTFPLSLLKEPLIIVSSWVTENDTGGWGGGKDIQWASVMDFDSIFDWPLIAFKILSFSFLPHFWENQ